MQCASLAVLMTAGALNVVLLAAGARGAMLMAADALSFVLPDVLTLWLLYKWQAGSFSGLLGL